MKGTLEKEILARTVADELEKYAGLLERIISQAERRVINGEDVPANEKVVSIFEEHTDIIVKGGRETVFGHKICLTAGRTSIVLDCTIEKGNPADVSLYSKMVDRHIGMYKKAPESVSADGGFSSEENARHALDSGVKNVSFGKRVGKALLKLLPPRWLHRKLQKFRAGIEGIISAMKRAVGLSRCLWEGWESFRSYVWSCVVAHNLKIMSRILAARTAAAA
jgi:IS5 family transposase